MYIIADQMASNLRNAASSVLEMMFTAPVLADREFPPADLDAPILVGLTFAGEVRGTFTVALDSATASRLALNFMGLGGDERLDRQSVVEVLGELANMLCGHFLGQLNYRDTFRLSTPAEVIPGLIVPRGHTYQRIVHLEAGAMFLQVAVDE